MAALSLKPPRPLTLIAGLVSAGYKHPTVTLHKFTEIREVVLLDKSGRPLEAGEVWEYIYTCTVTGEERRWGIATRSIPKWAKDGN